MSKIEVNEIDAQSGTTITVGSACKSVAVPGNVVKTNAVQASDAGNIISQSGTTITIGASGDTVSLASGASQSGFGRSGSVDWQTGSIKTSTFTAASGEGYFVDTSSGAVTANLPAGSAGAIVSFADYTRTFGTNALTISPNGSEKIGGVNGDLQLSVNGQALTLVYVDGTEGWVNVQNAEDTEVGAQGFLVATGGTITTCGNCKIHTFTGPGTFTVCCVAAVCGPSRNRVSYMVVAGGGAGGNGDNTGGGGAGGFREDKSPLTPYTASPLSGAGSVTVTETDFPITVGGGGTGGSGPGGCGAAGSNGSNSIFSTKTSTGGGGGGGGRPPNDQGQAGGSGGGNGHQRTSGSGGAGNTPSVSPPQGNTGGVGAGGSSAPQYGAGGGGGATVAACNGTPSAGGAGGNGATTSISGSPTAYAGGGGGGTESNCSAGAGGTGGGGAGKGNSCSGVAGTANTGGGGGGTGCGTPRVGGNGGSGVVIIRYKFQ